VGYDAVWSVELHPTFRLATCLLAGLLNYSSTLKMEAICSSETSGATERTTRRHIPEDDTLNNNVVQGYCDAVHKNLKSISFLFFQCGMLSLDCEQSKRRPSYCVAP
jgi:hypothetical protein